MEFRRQAKDSKDDGTVRGDSRSRNHGKVCQEGGERSSVWDVREAEKRDWPVCSRVEDTGNFAELFG